MGLLDDPNTHIQLSGVMHLVKTTFDMHFSDFSCRCVAEVLTIRQVNGRYYIDLVEYDKNNNIIAKAKGVIWNSSVVALFIKETSIDIIKIAGSKILMQVSISFSEEYGLSLSIIHISSNYMLGQRKKEQDIIIDKLTALGIYKKNLQTQLSSGPLHIAIISSQKSQGAEDFISVCSDSGFAISRTIFPSIIDGNKAKIGVHKQLQNIYSLIKKGEKYDAVAIVRGGGGSSGIDRQNDFSIAQGICHMPIPVILAIGHTSDNAVLDNIVKYPTKTPSDAGHMIIDHMQKQQYALDSYFKNIQSLVDHKKQSIMIQLDQLLDSIYLSKKNILIRCALQLDAMRQNILHYHPDNLQKRGYALIAKKDHTILQRTDIESLSKGESLTISIYGSIIHVSIDKIDIH